MAVIWLCPSRPLVRGVQIGIEYRGSIAELHRHTQCQTFVGYRIGKSSGKQRFSAAQEHLIRRGDLSIVVFVVESIGSMQNVKLNHYIAVFERVVLLCKICEQQTSNRIESLAIESGCIRG